MIVCSADVDHAVLHSLHELVSRRSGQPLLCSLRSDRLHPEHDLLPEVAQHPGHLGVLAGQVRGGGAELG